MEYSVWTGFSPGGERGHWTGCLAARVASGGLFECRGPWEASVWGSPNSDYSQSGMEEGEGGKRGDKNRIVGGAGSGRAGDEHRLLPACV